MDTGWRPVWTTLPAAAVGCRELIKCGCKAEPTCAKKCVKNKLIVAACEELVSNVEI